MSDISKITDSIKESDLEIGNLFENFISNHNIPVFIEHLPLIEGQPSAISLRSGVYLNNYFLDINASNVLFCTFVILHECGHFIRYNSIDYDVVSLTEFPLNEYLDKCKVEEDYANNFAFDILESWLDEMNNGRSKSQLAMMMQRLVPQMKHFQPNLYINMYRTIKKNISQFENSEDLLFAILKNKIPLNENKQMKSNEDIIRKKIAETLKVVFESPEVAPAEPKVKPDIKPVPARPAPRRILKPQIHPGAKPPPKAKSFEDFKKKKNKFLKEAPMDYQDKDHNGPNPSIKKNIETRGSNPFSKIDVLHKDNPNNQKSLEKLGDEEYKDVVDTAKKYKTDNLDYTKILEKIKEVMLLQVKHKATLERLAKNIVQKYFGIPDDVMAEIFVELKNDFGDIDFELDDDSNEEELLNDFTPEEIVIIKQNVDKRIISNALMMGAGFRAHNLLEKVKPALDAIEPKLFQFYMEIMSGHAFTLWKFTPSEEDEIQYDRKKGEDGQIKKIINNLQIGGKSELILGDDENGDGIREVKGAKAVAIIFPVLLHETVKAVMEYIFANGLPQYTENINKEIMRQSEKFHFEHWHKLLGPRLWKYLHDAIDYIVKARDSDYTIVAYLLQEISMLPPNKFLRLIDLLLHDGAKGVEWLEKMLDRVEYDLENQKIDIETDPVPLADFGKINNLMGHVNDMLKNAGAQEKPNVIQQKPFNQMTNQELESFIDDALDSGDFDKAAEARDELENRGL